MKSFEIEAWAIKIIERVEAGQPDEDSRVELKFEWPDVKKAARRIAAHANEARGEPILWLIGVNQQEHLVVGAVPMEVSSWYEQVKAEFDERIAPTVKDLNIPYKGKTVVALLFDTERFPFVVKAPDSRLEVPWREGTLTRSAKRLELLKLLIPLQQLPALEVFSGTITIERNNQGNFLWRANLDLYVELLDDKHVVIPFHKCKASLEIVDTTVELSVHRIGSPYSHTENRSNMIVSGQDEILVAGPGKLVFAAHKETDKLPDGLNQILRLRIHLMPAGTDQVVSLVITFSPSIPSQTRPNLLHIWEFDSTQRST